MKFVFIFALVIFSTNVRSQVISKQELLGPTVSHVLLTPEFVRAVQNVKRQVKGFEESGLIYAARVGIGPSGSWTVAFDLALVLGDTVTKVGSLVFTLESQLGHVPQVANFTFSKNTEELKSYPRYLLIEEKTEWDKAIGRLFTSEKYFDFLLALPRNLRRDLEDYGSIKKLKMISAEDQKSWEVSLQVDAKNLERPTLVEWHAKLFTVSSEIPELFAMVAMPPTIATCEFLFLK